MKTYIAGPMRGIPHYNFPAFFEMEGYLRAEGFDVFNPAQADYDAGLDTEKELPENFDMKEVCARDIAGLLTCDAIYMLPGWSDSKGATAERAVALWLGLEVMGAAA